MNTTWFIASKPGEAQALQQMAQLPAAEISVLALGTEEIAKEAAAIFANVKWAEAGCCPENCAEAAASYLAEEGAQVVFGYATPVVRTIAGLASAKASAAVISHVTGIAGGEGKLFAEHTIVDDKVIETLEVPAPCCLMASTVTFKPIEPAGNAQGAIEKIELVSTTAIELVEQCDIPASGIETAEYVVGVGRGIASQEMFDECKALADGMDAQISGTMPGVRDFGYFAPDAPYIGLSGSRLSAKVYIALGISGATPHLIGLMGAQRVVCVNKDSDAQLFDHADYGIVGDVAEIVPELARALA